MPPLADRNLLRRRRGHRVRKHLPKFLAAESLFHRGNAQSEHTGNVFRRFALPVKAEREGLGAFHPFDNLTIDNHHAMGPSFSPDQS